MVSLKDLFDKVVERQFRMDDARELMKRSFYFAGGTLAHADVHVVLAAARPADYHFAHVPQYEERSLHSMFESMSDAAHAIAASLNSKAGESALRFLSVRGVPRATIISRSGARLADRMMVRSAVASMGTRTGTMYVTKATTVVVTVLSIDSDQVFLTTAYPAHSLNNRPLPPVGSDLVELGHQQRFVYQCSEPDNA